MTKKSFYTRVGLQIAAGIGVGILVFKPIRHFMGYGKKDIPEDIPDEEIFEGIDPTIPGTEE